MPLVQVESGGKLKKIWLHDRRKRRGAIGDIVLTSLLRSEGYSPGRTIVEKAGFFTKRRVVDWRFGKKPGFTGPDASRTIDISSFINKQKDLLLAN
ncbi:hypothetical protein QUB05_13595 [Microcoleus sp. F10-C6]|uniref:hypothetical protein n=1 Tax=unclassified Microcoleus TaxID=2642155 RepID=UPI002FD6C69C